MPVRSREIHALSSRIQLPVLRKLLSIMDGHHSALRHGRGWEFMDLAPYQPGDDVREIDWAATARTGSPIIKRHEATANLQVMLVVDTGREMGALAPSGETKEEVALAACEVIAWLSAARGDQIGLVAGDDKREAPGSGQDDHASAQPHRHRHGQYAAHCVPGVERPYQVHVRAPPGDSHQRRGYRSNDPLRGDGGR